MNEPEYVEFTPDDLRAVLARMAVMAETHKGWINFEAAVPVEEAPPPRSALFGLFSTRGPEVPLATWHPGEVHRKYTEPPMIGIMHPAGFNAKAKLAERGWPVPDGWRVTQDYSKKGLVVAVPPTADHAQVLAWLLRAAASLSAVPVTGRWRAVIYDG